MDTELTDKQRRFVEEYCKDFNATRAAIRSGYSKDSARQMGSENLSKPYIKKVISERLDTLSMSSEEAVKRLTDWGRGSFEPFTKEDEAFGMVLDLKTKKARRNIHLIKKIKQTKKVYYNPTSEATDTEYTTEIELHDAKDAVDKIVKIRGMYVDKVESKSEIQIKKIEVEIASTGIPFASTEDEIDVR